jgi:TPR repeat protein
LEEEKLMYDVVTSYDKVLPPIGEGSVDFYKKEAKYGNPKAMFVMGAMYHMGEGVNRSRSMAIKFYRKAACEGIPEAQFMLGLMYFHGKGLEQDEKKAYGLFLKAAKTGLTAAQVFACFCYNDGTGVKINRSKSLKWALKAAKQGNSIAELIAGLHLSHKKKRSRKEGDPFVWFLRAAIHNNPNAQLKIGKMYLKGKAAPFYEESDCPGLTPASLSEYSTDPYNFYPTAPEKLRERLNRKEAWKWLSRAAEFGNEKASRILERFFGNG